MPDDRRGHHSSCPIYIQNFYQKQMDFNLLFMSLNFLLADKSSRNPHMATCPDPRGNEAKLLWNKTSYIYQSSIVLREEKEILFREGGAVDRVVRVWSSHEP